MRLFANDSSLFTGVERIEQKHDNLQTVTTLPEEIFAGRYFRGINFRD